MGLINNFTGDYEFLSIDANCDVMFNDLIYPTVRHALIAAKSDEHSFHTLVVDSDLETAKSIDREVFRSNKPSVDDYIDRVIKIVLDKYSRNRDFYDKLLRYIDPKNDGLDYSNEIDNYDRLISDVTMLIHCYGLDINKITEKLF